ncbi:putative lipid A core-O-antigen ligase-like enyme [Magnetofaba australis IT-1]|uniref:Putative lipid A core-O-antigen ligase-like enyme n=1 Tax=Magnetofaba australis IT-1 TaxID=1434232 RepID=A0A1Y2K8M8_9PROT|nr:putative lipid A core-O-antigen ligase-like enyme [Magnetofaba australis IT-1]
MLESPPSRLLFALLLLGVMMQFIPFPKLPVIHIAPINVTLGLGLMVFAFNIHRIFSIQNHVIMLLFYMVMFFLVYTFVTKFKDPTEGLELEYVRTVTLWLLFAVACRNLDDVHTLIKAICIGVFISALFGLLIHFLGDPWQGIRNWLLQDTSAVEEGISGKGMWISGLAGRHFSFGYLMAAAPILALTCYQARRKWIWFGVMAVMLPALFLNAERSSFLTAGIGMIYLLFRWKRAGVLAFLVMALVAGVVLEGSRDVENRRHQSLVGRFQDKGLSDTVDRLLWQLNGVETVFKNPFSGATNRRYEETVLGRHILVRDPSIKIPYAHNHYIVVGMLVGLVGWLFLAGVLYSLRRTIRQYVENAAGETRHAQLALGAVVSLIAVMCNGLFHNAGVFTSEPLTICLVGVVIAGAQMRGSAHPDPETQPAPEPETAPAPRRRRRRRRRA